MKKDAWIWFAAGLGIYFFVKSKAQAARLPQVAPTGPREMEGQIPLSMTEAVAKKWLETLDNDYAAGMMTKEEYEKYHEEIVNRIL